MVFETWITLATSYCVFLLFTGRYADVCEDGNCCFIIILCKNFLLLMLLLYEYIVPLLGRGLL